MTTTCRMLDDDKSSIQVAVLGGLGIALLAVVAKGLLVRCFGGPDPAVFFAGWLAVLAGGGLGAVVENTEKPDEGWFFAFVASLGGGVAAGLVDMAPWWEGALMGAGVATGTMLGVVVAGVVRDLCQPSGK